MSLHHHSERERASAAVSILDSMSVVIDTLLLHLASSEVSKFCRVLNCDVADSILDIFDDANIDDIGSNRRVQERVCESILRLDQFEAITRQLIDDEIYNTDE